MLFHLSSGLNYFSFSLNFYEKLLVFVICIPFLCYKYPIYFLIMQYIKCIMYSRTQSALAITDSKLHAHLDMMKLKTPAI